MYIFESSFKKLTYSYGFYFFKLNKLKIIHDLYFQCLTLILSKMIFFFLYGESTSLNKVMSI